MNGPWTTGSSATCCLEASGAGAKTKSPPCRFFSRRLLSESLLRTLELERPQSPLGKTKMKVVFLIFPTLITFSGIMSSLQNCTQPFCPDPPDKLCSVMKLITQQGSGCGVVNINQNGLANGCCQPGVGTETTCRFCFNANFNCQNCMPAHECDWSFTVANGDGTPSYGSSGHSGSESANFVMQADCGEEANAIFVAGGVSKVVKVTCEDGCEEQ